MQTGPDFGMVGILESNFFTVTAKEGGGEAFRDTL